MFSKDSSGIFHQLSKDYTRRPHSVPNDPNEWPSEWKTTYYKNYPRLPSIKLPNPRKRASLFTTLQERQSRRDFSRKSVNENEVSIVLQYSCGETTEFGVGRKRRGQASGGARFPIEVYPLVLHGSKKIPSSLYHYNVKTHELTVLWKREFGNEDADNLFSYPWVKNAAVVFLMTAVFWRTQNKYGERGYRYILLEAGHIAQNMYLTASALGLKCCALGGTEDEKIEELLDIDGITESLVYAVAVGK